MTEKHDVFNKEFIPFINKTGILMGLLGVAVSFLPIIVLLAVFGLMPPTSAILTAFVSIASAVGVLWFVEPISYFPVVGVAGTYMAFLSGNISNMRIPCAAVAQNSAGVEPGTDEGQIVATLGMAVSIIINIAVLTVGVIFGAAVLSQMPPIVKETLNYLLPALFGALFVQFAMKQLHMAPIVALIGIAFSTKTVLGVFSFLPGAPNYLPMLATIFISIACGLFFYKRSKRA